MEAAVAAEIELRPKVVEPGLVHLAASMPVVEPDAVMAEPMVVVAVILAVEPKEVGLGIWAGFVAPMVVEVENLLVLVVPMEPEAAAAALVLADGPRLVAFAASVARELVPRVAELVLQAVNALVVGPRVAEPVPEAVIVPVAGPRLAEHLSGFVLALAADSKSSDFVVSRNLWGPGPALDSE